MHIIDPPSITREPSSPAAAYAALAGLSTIAEPTFAQRRRMRFLARFLLDAYEAVRSGQVAA